MTRREHLAEELCHARRLLDTAIDRVQVCLGAIELMIEGADLSWMDREFVRPMTQMSTKDLLKLRQEIEIILDTRDGRPVSGIDS